MLAMAIFSVPLYSLDNPNVGPEDRMRLTREESLGD